MINTNVTPYDWFRFADNAYAGPSTEVPSGWEEVTGIPDGLLNQSTGYQAVVFRNINSGEIIISHRGSDELIDWKSANIQLVNGKLNPQFQNAQNLTEYIMAYYPNSTINHTGHSLGGWLSQMVGLANGQNAVSIDSPGALSQINLMNQILSDNEFTGACNNPESFITAFQSMTNPVNTKPFAKHIVQPVLLFPESFWSRVYTMHSLSSYLASGYFHTLGFIQKAFDINTGLLKFNSQYNQAYNHALTLAASNYALSTAGLVVKSRNEQSATSENLLQPSTLKTSNVISQLENTICIYNPRS